MPHLQTAKDTIRIGTGAKIAQKRASGFGGSWFVPYTRAERKKTPIFLAAMEASLTPPASAPAQIPPPPPAKSHSSASSTPSS